MAVLSTGGVRPAAAHGILQSSWPAPNAVLLTPPGDVVLTFNEPVDAAFSRITVVSTAGQNVAGPAQVGERNRQMRAMLPALPEGLYTVRWRVLSTIDGHVTAGSFVFAIGAREAPQVRPATGVAPSPALAALRWATLLTALLLAGIVVFRAAVLTPAVSRMAPETALLVRDVALPRLETWRVLAAGLLLVALALEFVGQAAVLFGADLPQVARRSVLGPLLVETRPGWSLLVRAAMACLLLLPGTAPWRILRLAGLVWFVILVAVIVFLGGPAAVQGSHVTVIVLVATVYGLASVIAAVILPGVRDVRIPEGRWIPPAAAAILLWGYTLSSHAASGGAIAIIVDWLHFMGVALWVGGLPALLRILSAVPAPSRQAVGRVLVPRVSQAAALALVVVIITGVLAAVRNVGSWSALLLSLYGRMLLVKLALVLPLVVLGALNRFVYRPRIERGERHHEAAGALRRFRRSVVAEVVLGVLILLVVAVLSITPPAAVTQPAAGTQPLGDPGAARRGVALTGFAGDLRVRLDVSPALPGQNALRVEVTRLDAGAQVTDAAVSVRLHALDRVEDHQTDLRPRGSAYVGAADLPPGWWEIAVLVRRDGEATDVRLPLVVGEPSRHTDPAAARLLERVRSQMRTIRSWIEVEHLTDGAGNVVGTRFEIARPDRLRYRTTSGSEAIIIGQDRYSREQGGEWSRDALPQPLALEGLYLPYLAGADTVRFGREEPCANEPCRVLLWDVPSAQASFAARAGLRTGRIYTLAMVAPRHYMTSEATELNAPIQILPP